LISEKNQKNRLFGQNKSGCLKFRRLIYRRVTISKEVINRTPVQTLSYLPQRGRVGRLRIDSKVFVEKCLLRMTLHDLPTLTLEVVLSPQIAFSSFQLFGHSLLMGTM